MSNIAVLSVAFRTLFPLTHQTTTINIENNQNTRKIETIIIIITKKKENNYKNMPNSFFFALDLHEIFVRVPYVLMGPFLRLFLLYTITVILFISLVHSDFAGQVVC